MSPTTGEYRVSDAPTIIATLTEEQLDRAARICHLCWVSYQLGAGQGYNLEPDANDLASHRDAIAAILANPTMTAAENHENWMRFRQSEGWVWGPVKDKEKKTHPDLVPFDQLPDVEQRKDTMDLLARRFALRLVGVAI